MSDQGPIADLRAWLVQRTRFQKRAILVALDLALLTAVLWLAVALRRGSLFYKPLFAEETALLFLAPAITVATFGYFGLYKLVTRYIGARGTTRILFCVLLSVLVWALVVFMAGQHNVPRTVILTYGVGAALAVWVSRVAARAFLEKVGIDVPALRRDNKPVLIYGAGPAGQQLRNAIQGRGYNVLGFIDRSETMWGQYIGATKVYRPDKIDQFIASDDVAEILLALPSSARQQRREILAELEHKPVSVKIMPAIEDIATGRIAVTELRPVDVIDLLGRDPVPPNHELLSRNITGQSILVTGAGGSVGSELVRQILRLQPTRLVLFEASEIALYDIDLEVRAAIALLPQHTLPPEVHAILGTVLDKALVLDCLRRFAVDTVYHAAAYKHVPIVEDNAIAGLGNNTFGARVVAEAAREAGTRRVVLISTDKAVRPTNIMGASKRLAELVLQSLAGEGGKTVFTMVRFGNVLGSSGSVVRRFRSQIRAGGPLTVTHPDITRYFMSIQEAAELVIQAGAMAEGGEVFVLDMGDPVRIVDLARMMIRLSGYEVRDAANPDGDIAIEYTGLRPGEKLYEELLIAANPNTTATEHPRIMRSHEPFLPPEALARELELLRTAMVAREVPAIKAILERVVEGYTPYEQGAPKPVDPVWSTTSRTLH